MELHNSTGIKEVHNCFIITRDSEVIMFITRDSEVIMFITRDSEVIMFSPCVFVCLCVVVCLCLSRCLFGRLNYEGLVSHKKYFAGTLLGMSSCARFVHALMTSLMTSQDHKVGKNFKLIYLRQYLSYSVDQKLKLSEMFMANFWCIQLLV